jgi:hypothetical protein
MQINSRLYNTILLQTFRHGCDKLKDNGHKRVFVFLKYAMNFRYGVRATSEIGLLLYFYSVYMHF